MIKISSDFDHANILCRDASDASNIQLEIKPDGKAEFFQWFYYRVDGASGQNLTMNLTNANGASYLGGWRDYNAVASYDGEDWFRVDTKFDHQTLTINHTPDQDQVYYAYFAAYPVTRYQSFIKEIKGANRFDHAVLGQTLDGQDIDYFRIGESSENKKNLWVIARQHPGETMGSWWMEGFFQSLLGDEFSGNQSFKDEAVLHVIPCMNLDGSKRGHLRTNAAGVDLNRAWQNASMEKSPEVYLVREKMRETGVDFFLDVHGDEAIANNFLDGAQGIPKWNEWHANLFERYSSMLLAASKDFQTKEGYPTPPPGKANIDIANNYVAHTWDCLAITLEMPFKDAKVNPDPVHGWSPERCRSFATENLQVIMQIARDL